MGDISEYYQALDFDRMCSFQQNSNKPKKNAYIWLQANGKKIKVKNMSNSHVQNTLRCIEEGRICFDSENELMRWIKIFSKELNHRGLKKLPIRYDPDCDATENDIY